MARANRQRDAIMEARRIDGGKAFDDSDEEERAAKLREGDRYITYRYVV